VGHPPNLTGGDSCKNLTPERVGQPAFNGWVSERSEYTRMHAFVNSPDLALTANRGSVENTPQDLLADIEATIRKLFELY
jgi:hypothetical protein